MDEKEIFEAFGLEAPDNDAGDNTDTDIDTDTGSDTDTDTDGGSNTDTDGKSAGDTDGDDAKTQTKDERAGYAAARRRAEAEAREREAKAVKEAEERATIATLKALGAKNPYTGKIIETAADLEAYRKDQSENAKQKFMRSSGQSEEAYRQTVENLPEVAEAMRKAKEAEARAAAAEDKIRETEEADFKRTLDEEIRRIAETGEDVKTLEDVTKLEKFPEIREKIQRGYSLEDAYHSVYRKEIAERQANVRANRAAAAAASKSHLSRTSSKGDAGVTVPSDVIAYYHLLMPGMSDADIVKHYSKEIKSKKGK